MSDYKEDLINWIKEWQSISKTVKREIPPKQSTSPVESDSPETLNEDIEWSDIYNNINKLNEARKHKVGYGSISKENPKNIQANPQYYNAIGPDSEGEDGTTPVTKDFSGGEKLDELHYLKIRIEKLERKVHKEELAGTKKKYNKLKKRLDRLRKKAEKLSEEITPDQNYDTA